MTAAFIHVVGDFLQSLGVFIAAIVIYFKPEWNIIDPICTFVFSLLVLATTISILRKTLSVLLEATPSDINYDIVKSTFLSVKGIRQIHSLRWNYQACLIKTVDLLQDLGFDNGQGSSCGASRH